jgi:hypothetical protein
MMEHRLGRRLPVNIPARLRFGDGTFGWGRVTNISRDGMFVESGARPRRAVGCLDVRITVPGPTAPTALLIPAFVMHQANGGYGLLFRQLTRQTRETVSWLLRSDVPRFDHAGPSQAAVAGGVANRRR